MNANLLRGDGEDLTCGIQEGFPDGKYRVTEFLFSCFQNTALFIKKYCVHPITLRISL